MIPRYRDIIDLIKKGSTVEAQEKIMELREGALELQEENQFLKEKIRELEAKLKIQGNLQYDSGVYWLWEEDGAGDNTVKTGPFCQRCQDVDSRLVRLQGGENDVWDCHGCGKTTLGKNYVEPPPISFS
jgi:hypothetical protein